MRNVYIFFLLLISQSLFAQDTIYVFSKFSPIQKIRHRELDSISIKKPNNINADSLVFYYKTNQTLKLAISTIDSVTFKPPYVKPVLPSITTNQAVINSSSNVILGGNILSTGGGFIREAGIYYSNTPGVTSSSNKIIIPAGIGDFKTLTINQFNPAETYYFRAYAINDAGLTLGNELSFTTPVGLPILETGSFGALGQTYVQLNGIVTNSGGSAITNKGFLISTSNTLLSPITQAINDVSDTLKANITGLIANTTYYYAAFATNAQGTSVGTIESFKTALDAPSVSTIAVGQIGTITANVTGYVLDYVNNEVFERGIVYSTSPNPTFKNDKIITSSLKDTFSVTIQSLIQNTTYYTRAYARNSVAIVYGEEKSFTTLVSTALKPTVNTLEVQNITSTSFDLIAEITNDGGSPIIETGLEYGIDSLSMVDFSIKSIQKIEGTGNFIVKANGFAKDFNFLVRAYAKNDAGIAYGKILKVKTLAEIPTLEDEVIDRTNPLTRTLGLRLQVSGAGLRIYPKPNFSAGYVISTTNQNTTLTSNDTVLNADANFYDISYPDGYNALFKDISTTFYARGGTKYYIRAFATNSAGTGYSKTDSVMTDPTTPDLKILYSYRIEDTCYFGFEVENNGGLAGIPTKVGYTTRTSIFAPDGPYVSLGTAKIGEYHSKVYYPSDQELIVTPLVENTFGNGFTFFQFLPLPPGVPKFGQLQAVTAIGVNTAKVSYNVLKPGAFVSGILISTNPDASGGVQRVLSGGIGDFFEIFTDLIGGTTYYYKAFATNDIGTGYGEVGTFKTLPLSIGNPTVSALNSNNVLIRADITNSGASNILESGFVYSASPNPTLNNTKVVSLLNSNYNVESRLNNLLPYTKYYARVYAKNDQGTVLGSEISFTTLVGTPVVEVVSVNNVTQTSVEINCNVLSNGGQLLLGHGVFVSTDKNNMTQKQQAFMANVQNAYAVNIINLIPGKTYYTQAYVLDKDGKFVYSPISTFSTLPPDPVFGTTKIEPFNESKMILTLALLNNTENGGKDILEIGFCYNIKGLFVDTNAIKTSYKTGFMGTGLQVELNNLNVNNTYEARPFILNKSGLFYGNKFEFTPLSITAKVVTGSPKAIGSYSIIMNSTLESKGQGKMIRTGFLYGSNTPLLTVGASGVQMIETTLDTIIGNKVFEIKNLIAGNTYRVRAFAENSKGISYGNTLTLYTPMLNSDLDGNIYDTVEINGYVWMASNLRTKTYNDGTPIFIANTKNIWIGATTDSVPAQMYGLYKFNSTSNNDILGLYYNYAVVETQKVCPYGWHVPTETEYKNMLNFIADEQSAGFKLKKPLGYPAWANQDSISTDPSNWAATPGSFISDKGTFDVNLGFLAYWWTSTGGDNPKAFKIYNEESAVTFRVLPRSSGLNIRCIKD